MFIQISMTGRGAVLDHSIHVSICACVPAGVCMHLHVYLHVWRCTYCIHVYVYLQYIVLVIVYEVPYHVLLEIYILVLPTKVTLHNLYQCTALH